MGAHLVIFGTRQVDQVDLPCERGVVGVVNHGRFHCEDRVRPGRVPVEVRRADRSVLRRLPTVNEWAGMRATRPRRTNRFD